MFIAAFYQICAVDWSVRWTDLCGGLICAVDWSVRWTDLCGGLICAVDWSVRWTDLCGGLICAVDWSVRWTDLCGGQICAVDRSVRWTDLCGGLICAVYCWYKWHNSWLVQSHYNMILAGTTNLTTIILAHGLQSEFIHEKYVSEHWFPSGLFSVITGKALALVAPQAMAVRSTKEQKTSCNVDFLSVVWCGVAWRGVVWRGVVWRGVIWRGVMWC